MINRRSAAALWAGMLLVMTPVLAIGGENLAEKTGKWTFTMNDPAPDVKKLGPARLKNLRTHLQEIARLIASSPAMSPPRGFEARFWGSASSRDRYDICNGKKCPPSPPSGVLALMIGSYGETDGKVKAAFNRAATMDIAVNNLGQLFAHLPVLARDSDGIFLPQPQRDGERQGMPVYLNNGHAVAVLSRNDAPFWLPVSRERYLRAAIVTLEKELGQPEPAGKKAKAGGSASEPRTNMGKSILREESRSWIDPATEKAWVEKSRTLSFDQKESAEQLTAHLEKLRSELASLTPEQGQQQARVESATPERSENAALLPVDSSAGVGVVTPNFAFFNRNLPADSVQLVTLQWKFDGTPVFDPDKTGITENLQNSRLLDIYRSVAWQKLGDRLHPR